MSTVQKVMIKAYVPPVLKQVLATHSAAVGITMQDVMTRALATYLKAHAMDRLNALQRQQEEQDEAFAMGLDSGAE